MQKSETLNLRVSPEFKRRLIEEARGEKRSVTNYIEATLTRLWQQKRFKRENRPQERNKRS